MVPELPYIKDVSFWLLPNVGLATGITVFGIGGLLKVFCAWSSDPRWNLICSFTGMLCTVVVVFLLPSFPFELFVMLILLFFGFDCKSVFVLSFFLSFASLISLYELFRYGLLIVPGDCMSPSFDYSVCIVDSFWWFVNTLTDFRLVFSFSSCSKPSSTRTYWLSLCIWSCT